MESSVWGYRDKPTLLELREKYGVGIEQLANKSDVEPSIVYCMLLSRPVRRSVARRVLKGLSLLAGVDYSLDNVHVALSEEVEEYQNWR